MSPIEGPILRMRSTAASTAASNGAYVLNHQAGVYSHGGPSYLAYIGRPGGEYRLLRVPFCESAMQSAPPLDPTLRAF